MAQDGGVKVTGTCPDTEVCIEYDEITGQYVLTTNYGNEKNFPPAPVKVEGEVVVLDNVCYFDILVNKVRCDRVELSAILDKVNVTPDVKFNDDNCTLVVCVGENSSDPIPLIPLLRKYEVNYDPATHTIITTINGVQHQDPQVLNCGSATIAVNDAGQCVLRYTNEKGVSNDELLPQAMVSHDPVACTFTFSDPAKPNVPPLVIPAGVPSEQFQAGLDENCDIKICYKDVERTVVLPNFVTDVTFNPANCTVAVSYWKGDPTVTEYLGAIDLTKDPDTGAAILTVKGVVCPILPPLDPDGHSEQGVVQADGTDGNGNTIVDFAGNNIASGAQVINYYDGDGNYVNSKDCTDVFASITSNDGSIQITSSAGPGGAPTFDVSFTETVTSLVVDPDNPTSILFTDEDGNSNSIDIKSLVDGCFPIVEPEGDNVDVTTSTGPNGEIIYTVSVERECCISSLLCAPGGSKVIVVIDPFTETRSYFNTDGTAYTGDTSALTDCIDSTVSDNGDGTATITQSDGTTKSNLVCGAQSTVTDNENNTATLTQNDGTSETVITQLNKKSGLLSPGTDVVLTAADFASAYADWNIPADEVDDWTEPAVLRSDGCIGIPKKPRFRCYPTVVGVGSLQNPDLPNNSVLTPTVSRLIENNTCYPMEVAVFFHVEHAEIYDDPSSLGSYICMNASSDGGASFTNAFHIGGNAASPANGADDQKIGWDIRGGKWFCYTIPAFSSQEFQAYLTTCFNSGNTADQNVVNPRVGIFAMGGCA